MKKSGNISLLMLVILISKLIGLLREVVLANFYGTSAISDAYLIAISVPTFLFFFVGHSIATAYIPIYNSVKEHSGKDSAQKYSNNLLNISLMICLILFLAIFIFTKQIVNLYAPGFDEKTSELAVKFIKISSFSLFFMCLVQLFSGYLQINHSFLAPAAISLPRNAVIMFSIVLSYYYGVYILGIGILIAYAFEFILLVPFLFKHKYKYRLYLNLKTPEIKETLYMIVPILLGMFVSQINKIVDRSIASTIIVGGISSLTYASIINNSIQEILILGIITILFANCATLVAKNEHEKVKDSFYGTVKYLGLILIPVSVGVIILAEPIVKTVLMRGNFNNESLKLTVMSLRGYTIGLTFLAIRDTTVKIFYAYKNTKTTTVTSILAILINIILNIILGRILGVFGLAVATSISAVFHCLVLCHFFKKKYGDNKNRKVIETVIKSIIGSAGMGVFVVYLYKWLSYIQINDLLTLVLCLISGATVYFIIGIFLKNPVVKDMSSKILIKFRREK